MCVCVCVCELVCVRDVFPEEKKLNKFDISYLSFNYIYNFLCQSFIYIITIYIYLINVFSHLYIEL